MYGNTFINCSSMILDNSIIIESVLSSLLRKDIFLGRKVKNSSRNHLILGVNFIISSLLWFQWVKNTPMGVIWVCIGLVELFVALIRKKKEKK